LAKRHAAKEKEKERRGKGTRTDAEEEVLVRDDLGPLLADRGDVLEVGAVNVFEDFGEDFVGQALNDGLKTLRDTREQAWETV